MMFYAILSILLAAASVALSAKRRPRYDAAMWLCMWLSVIALMHAGITAAMA